MYLTPRQGDRCECSGISGAELASGLRETLVRYKRIIRCFHSKEFHLSVLFLSALPLLQTISHHGHARREKGQMAPITTSKAVASFGLRALSLSNRNLRASSTARKSVNVQDLLATPTWSVGSLLPKTSDWSTSSEKPISRELLRHLLRLSALPIPKTEEEERRLVGVLESQLYFVRDIQRVDVSSVEPLRSIRDESEEGRKEATIGLEQLRHVLSVEIAQGHRRRPKRSTDVADPLEPNEDSSAVMSALRPSSGYFVVRTGQK